MENRKLFNSTNMKITDVVTKRILAASFGIMGILLCASFLMRSVTPSYALDADLPSSFSPAAPPAAASGTIMMDYTSVHVPSQDKTYYECMVWNTATGESRLYYYDYSSKSFKAYENNVQLPSSPLN